MLSSIITHEDKAVAAALKHRIMQAAFYHDNSLDARTVFLLQKNELLKNVHRTSVREDIQDILSSPEHPDRLPCDWGPFVFVRDGDKRMGVVVVADLLIDDDAELRNTALQYLDLGIRGLTSRTTETVETRRERLSTPSEWLTASISINDALREDFAFNLAGVRQCLQQPYTEGLEQCLETILRPSLGMLAALRPTIWNPIEQQDEIRREISVCVYEAQTLSDALERYYSRLGYLPLAASFSMPEIVRQWLSQHPSQENVWKELWSWADASIDSLKGYYAAFTFLSRPDLIEMPDVNRLWSAVADIVVQGDDTQSNSDKYRPWKLRCDLSRHYCQYLECLFPGQDGEKLATSSWWLAHQVLAMMPSTGAVEHLCKDSVRQYESASHHVHTLCHPQTKGSALRYATLFLPSVWSLSLLCQVGRNATSFVRDGISSAAHAQIAEKLGGYLVTGFPRIAVGRSAVYAFEDSIVHSAIEWAQSVGDQTDIDRIKALAALHAQEVTAPQLLEMMDNVGQYAPAVQFLVIRLLSLAAYLDHVPAEELWTRLQKPDWLHSTIRNISIKALPFFCDCLIEVMVKANPEWGVYLSHLFSIEYSACPSDKERQQHMLLFVIVSCLGTGTASGLERLVQETSSDISRAISTHWQKTLAFLTEVAPPWVAGRSRPLLVALHKRGY